MVTNLSFHQKSPQDPVYVFTAPHNPALLPIIAPCFKQADSLDRIESFPHLLPITLPPLSVSDTLMADK